MHIMYLQDGDGEGLILNRCFFSWMALVLQLVGFDCFWQAHGRALVESSTDYQADNSRSDLSDILEEEEEDLYSEHSAAQARGYAIGSNRVKECRPCALRSLFSRFALR